MTRVQIPALSPNDGMTLGPEVREAPWARPPLNPRGGLEVMPLNPGPLKVF